MSEWRYAIHDEEFKHTDESGKWLLFFSPQFIAEWWTKIEAATLAGELGPVAKRSLVPRKGKFVICVYARDKKHAMEVREGLRGLGVHWKLPWKYDYMTARGQSGSAFSA